MAFSCWCGSGTDVPAAECEGECDELMDGGGVQADTPRPEWLPSSGPGNCSVPPPEWALSLRQLLFFLDECMASPAWRGIVRKKGYADAHDVSRHFVRPWTRGTGSSISLLMNRDQPLQAKVMISHSWAGDIEQSRAGVLAWMRQNDLPSDLEVWFCLFSVYQPGDEAGDGGPSILEQHELDPVGQVLPSVAAHFGLAVLHTANADVYSRLWCVYEIEQAAAMGTKTYGIGHLTPSDIMEMPLEVDARKATCGSKQEEYMLRDRILGGQEDGGKCTEEDDQVEVERTLSSKGSKKVEMEVIPYEIQRLNSIVTEYRLAMALSFAVRHRHVPACSRLLAANANPNVIDARGCTCLHLAARSGDIAVVDLLVKEGADCGLLDDDGNCPANLIPLCTGDDTSIRLLKSLAPSHDVAALTNAFGTEPFRRFKIWAKVALGGKPFEDAMACTREFEERWPALAADEPPLVRRSFSRRNKTSTLNFRDVPYNGRQVRIYTKRAERDVRGSVLIFSLVHPWRITLEGLRPLTESLCTACQVNVHVISYHAVRGEEDVSLDDFMSEVLALVDSLKLPGPLYFIDDSEGLAASVAWRMQCQPNGMVFINPSHFYSEDFIGTEEHTSELARMEEAWRSIARRDPEHFVQGITDIAFAAVEKDLQAMQAKMIEVFGEVDAEWWGLAASNLTWCGYDKAEMYQKLEPMHSTPALVVCGMQAPQISVVESSLRFRRRLLPESKLVLVPHSKVWWKLEGMRQAEVVANSIVDFIQSYQHR